MTIGATPTGIGAVYELARRRGFVTAGISPTSQAMVDVSDRVVASGGSEVSRVEYSTAERAGKPVAFFPADMNHANARKRAASRGLAAPTDFRGALGAALVGRRRQILNGSDRRPLRGPAHSVR